MRSLKSIHKSLRLALLAAACLSATGCALPLIAAGTGVAVTAMTVSDRRTLGAQTDDQSIEIRASSRIEKEIRDSGGISVTSYNRKVLLTGQVLDEKARQTAESIVSRLDNVRSVQNELKVSARAGLRTAASDFAITARVKSAFIDSKPLQSNTFKIVTESGVVYLMGIVTHTEGEIAAAQAARVSGVLRVVTVFEYVTADELANIERRNSEAAPKQ